MRFRMKEVMFQQRVLSGKVSRLSVVLLLVLSFAAACSSPEEDLAVLDSAGDPLPSWNEGAAKQAIIEFVDAVTDPENPEHVEPARRIATFDNDGTLWLEYPMYTQMLFSFDRVKALAPQHPEWATQQRITVLKASHHGARNGVTPAFLSATRPKAVVISVGEDNGYGHPHEWALEYYKTVADETYRTDMHGEVRIVGALDGAYEVRTVWGDRFARAGDNPKLNEDISDDATHVDVWVYPDALGYDQFNLNGEYAVIKNNSTATMTIAAWQLCNVERRCYTFPPGAAIAAHDSVFVHSGVGHTQSHKFYMRQTQPVWDDNTGRATLIDENGRVVARYAY